MYSGIFSTQIGIGDLREKRDLSENRFSYKVTAKSDRNFQIVSPSHNHTCEFINYHPQKPVC